MDGQQRSTTLLDYYENKFAISGQKTFEGYGKKYEDLEEHEQQKFLEYQVNVDLFISATEDDIRELFRRMNSYNVPLKPQEIRHATYQGEFKWFIVNTNYSQIMKDLGVFTETQLVRMQDDVLMSEFLISLTDGIYNGSERKLDKYYKDNDASYPYKEEAKERVKRAFDHISNWDALHKGPLMRSYNFLILLLAVSHSDKSCPALLPLQGKYNLPSPKGIEIGAALENLSILAESLESPEQFHKSPIREYISACSKATNTLSQRELRFKWLYSAICNQMPL